jgi:hypothetical protein
MQADTPKPPMVITVRVCPATAPDTLECQTRRREWARVKDEADLHELIWKDLENLKAGQLDISLRARITAICTRLAKNNY